MSRVSSLVRVASLLLVAVFIPGLFPMTAQAGLNPDFRIVLHAKQSSFEPCNGYLPVDCTSVQPTVNVQSAPITVFVLLANYQQASGIETAFSWSGWVQTFSIWDCSGIICDPGPCNFFPPGASGGTVAGTFPDCVNGPALKVIGTMSFVPAGNSQCIRMVQPSSPLGIHLIDCNDEIDQITDENSPRLGRICVGAGGVNACSSVTGVDTPGTSAQVLFSVGPSQPNPFNPSTTLTYTLPVRTEVSVTVYDATGRVVCELSRRVETAGEHMVSWDGRDDAGAHVSSGVYHIRVEADGQAGTQKIVLIK